MKSHRETSSFYNAGCRCSDCRAGRAAYAREWRARNPKRWHTVPRVCEKCKKEFLARPTSPGNPRPGRFCSIECAGNTRGKALRTMVYKSDHPIASVDGRVLIYRLALYDLIGPGTHPCHWCSTPVTWTNQSSRGRRTHRDLVVDHLDGNPRNNEPNNLVPACSRCNVLRGLLNSWLGATGKSLTLLVNANC